MRDTAQKIVSEALEEAAAELTEVQTDKLIKYFSFLLDWNTKINLISRKSPEDVLRTSLIESYSLYELILEDNGKFLDVGSGGGLPGIIIAILMPDSEVELLDSIRKKTDFLSKAADHLGLNNVRVTNKRLENIDLKIKYDIIFSRGVGNFDNLKKHCFDHIGNTGRVILLTGEDNSSHFRNYDVIENPFLAGRIIANLEK